MKINLEHLEEMQKDLFRKQCDLDIQKAMVKHFIKKEKAKQLTLTDVSQQRELLLAYEDYLNEYHTKEDSQLFKKKKMKDLKLFIWKDVLTDYTSGIAFALAENAEEARKIIFAKFEKEEQYLSDTLKADLSDEPEMVDSKDGFYVWGGG